MNEWKLSFLTDSIIFVAFMYFISFVNAFQGRLHYLYIVMYNV